MAVGETSMDIQPAPSCISVSFNFYPWSRVKKANKNRNRNSEKSQYMSYRPPSIVMVSNRDMGESSQPYWPFVGF